MKKLKLMFGAAAVVGSLVTGTCDAMLSENEGRAERSVCPLKYGTSGYEKAVEDLEAVRSERGCFESLYQAVTESDWNTVGNILETNIHHLVEQGRLKEIDSLMCYIRRQLASDSCFLGDSRVDILNSTDARERTPLLIALENNNFAAARSLVEWGASVDVLDGSGNNVLHHAVKQGNMRFIRLFADKTGDINAQNKYDQMALHLAAEEGDLEVARVLIDHGADPFIKNDYEISPLDVVQDRTDFSS